MADRTPTEPPAPEDTTLFACIRARRAESGRFEPRSLWWGLLDWWEASPRLRRITTWGLPAAVILAAAGFWFVPRWYRHNTIRLAEDWLRTGNLRNAAGAIKSAIQDSPDNPDTWRVAAEFARRAKRWPLALEYSRRAARLDPSSPDRQLDVASDALVVGELPEVAQALAAVPASALDASGRAQRIVGELALRQQRLDDACKAFRTSIRLEGSRDNNEIPLGSTLLASTTPAERTEGLELLEKWAPDPRSGALALRPLLADALARNDETGMHRYAMALMHHPACLIGDMPKCLLALSRSDEGAYQSAVTDLERVHRTAPEKAALLLGWLNQIGRGDTALAFGSTLPAAMQSAPPVSPSLLEALRIKGEWSRLLEKADAESWTPETDFLRVAYAMLAAGHLGDTRIRDQDWKALKEHCELTHSHALFVGDALYTWGLEDQAVELLWLAAKDPNYEQLALQTLARHYQVHRDAEGQYRVFRLLYSEHPEDPDIANNYAFFAALGNHDGSLALDVARRNFAAHPDSLAYRSTYAFVLARQIRTADAFELLKPVKADLAKAPGLRYTYAIVLALMGRKDDARELAKNVDSDALTIQEDALLQKLIREDIPPN